MRKTQQEIDKEIKISISVAVADGVKYLDEATIVLSEARKYNKSSYLIYDSNAEYVIKEKKSNNCRSYCECM